MPEDSTNTSGRESDSGNERGHPGIGVSAGGLWPSQAQPPDLTAFVVHHGDGERPADEPDRHELPVPRVPGVSEFGADDAIEAPFAPDEGPNRGVGETAMRRGTVDPDGFTHTHRMLIGMLVTRMTELEVNQADLAVMTGLSAPYISQLISGQRTGSFLAWDKVLGAVQHNFVGLGTFKPPSAEGAKRGRKARLP